MPRPARRPLRMCSSFFQKHSSRYQEKLTLEFVLEIEPCAVHQPPSNRRQLLRASAPAHLPVVESVQTHLHVQTSVRLITTPSENYSAASSSGPGSAGLGRPAASSSGNRQLQPALLEPSQARENLL